MGSGITRQQFVEFGRTVTDTIRARDDDLPALVGKGPSLGNGGSNA